VRISELADEVGVPVSTVRYYERIGLLAEPARTGSGYREYDDDAATQLLFVTRARKLGLTCEQIVELLPIWGGTHCTPTRDEVARLMRERGVATAPYVPSIHLQPYMRERYGFSEGMLPVSEDCSARTLALPFHARLDRDDQEYVVDALRSSLA